MPARVAGSDGQLTTLKEDSPFGGVEIDALFTLSRPDGLFYLICIAPEKDYTRVQPSFQQIADSVRFP